MNSPPLRVSVVSYLNTVPLVWGMLHGPQRGIFHLDFTVPSQCAEALRDGRAEAGILPSIEYQRIPGLKIVPGLSISSSGPVRSVLLLSRCPAGQIRSLALDTSSRTSACLAQILLKRHYQISPQLKPREPNLSGMLQECDAAMMIGDPALASDFPGLYVYDLAEEWHAMTGLPFVFAFWAVRAEAASSDLVGPFQQSTAYGLEHVEEIAQAESQRTGLPVPLIRTYLTENIDFSLGTTNLQGLQRFSALAQDMGLINRNKPLEFIG
jgi:chorismate dehydratase